MTWYVQLTQTQADELNMILTPVYCPGVLYLESKDYFNPAYPFSDTSGIVLATSNESIPQNDRDFISNILAGKKTENEARAAGWLPEINDG
jgi:hypothetical protein